MRAVKKLFPKLLFIIYFIQVFPCAYAQDVAQATKTVSSSNNQLVILIGLIALILAFVIWGMGQVLLTLSKQLLDKNKHHNKIITVVMLIGLSLISLPSGAQGQAAEIIKAVPGYGGLDSIGFWMLVTVLMVETIAIATMMFFINRLQAELIPKTQKQNTFNLNGLWRRLDKKLFTKAVAVEKEADILLDHDYDGIKELDNALPPWWKYGFMITIVIAFIYLLNFHVLGYGKNPTEEYQEEIAKAKEAKEIYDAKNKDKIDETNLKMPLADGIDAGREIFTTMCWACHGKQGEGGAGPNLTDNYWLHKGSLADIYISIKHGYPDKGMQAWEKNYSPKEINDLAGFIKTLKGTNPPNSKAPQGELYSEEAMPDSTITATVKMTDSSQKITAAITNK